MVPPALRDRHQWLVWRFEKNPDPKKEKPLKVPYYARGRWRHFAKDRPELEHDMRFGDQGSPEDRAKLVTYDEALRFLQERPPGGMGGGVGFAFLPGDGLIGIDLDKVIDKATGEISERARNIINECASYTEYSPSKTGVHIIGAGDTAFLFEDGKSHSFKSNKIGVEVFCGAQYFTFTGEQYSGTAADVQPLSEQVLRRLYVTVKQRRPGSSSSNAASALPMPADNDYRRADAALAYVDAEDYQTWIDIGHALKHAFGSAGFGLWDRWSRKSAKYPGEGPAAKKWESLNPNGSLKLGTVFELAKRGGWIPPRTPRRSKGATDPQRPPDDDGDKGGTGKPPAQGGGEGESGDTRPVIKWKQGKLHDVVDQAEDALLKSGARIYQRAGFLVRVVRRDTPSVRHYKRPPGALGLVMVDAPYLIEAFTRAARWFKFSAQKNDWVPTNAPEQAAATYISRRGHWQLPRLWSAISAPTLRPDGTVLQEAGYDPLTMSWYDPCGTEFPAIPEQPTRDDALRALKIFSDAFASFPYESEVDKSVALALALTALVRRSLPAAPLGGITAPIMASGKTLLADCIAILATGVSAPAMKYADTDEEATKTMLAVLAEGDQVVLIDNVERPLEGDTLCAVVTSEAYRQRVLGRTEMMSVPTTTLFLATGNHLVVAGDLRTRALLCRIDPKTEHPEQRQFEGEKREWMTEHRPELVAAGLTIMRAFIATGQLPSDHCKTWGRFERWSDMVRAPLIWLDCDDPCASLKDLERDDPERVELMRAIAAWENVFGDEKYTAGEAIERATSNAPEVRPNSEQQLYATLREIAKDRDGTLNSRRLGNWLRRHENRLVSAAPAPGDASSSGKPAPPKRFVRAGEKDHTLLWKVETMS